jgi:hypothetical protein
MPTLGDISQTSKGKIALSVVAIVCIVAGLWSLRNYVHASSAADIANTRVFVDAETGQAFNYTITPTMTLPVTSPDTGKQTGYPAELCYWTADGQIKDEPTAVVLNSTLDPTSREPTFCPDCGRLVVAHNPKPRPGDRPPPTRQEYYAQRGITP